MRFQVGLKWILIEMTFLSFACKPYTNKSEVKDVINEKSNRTAIIEPNIVAIATALKNESNLTIPDLLGRLPESYRSHFTGMLQSLSGQDGSRTKKAVFPGNPRIILFGKDAKLILAFNGHPKQEGYQKIEAIQYNEQTNAFDFYEIAFNERGMNGVVSNPNPAPCQSCHSGTRLGDMRPNWDQYSTWAGAYGSQKDLLAKIAGHPHDPVNEREDFLIFKRNMQSHQRYNKLLFPPNDLKINVTYAPYLGPSSDSEDENIIYLAFAQKPNLTLTKLITRLNAKRLANRIVKEPGSARFAAILPLLRFCRDANSLAPVLNVLKSADAAYAMKFSYADKPFPIPYVSGKEAEEISDNPTPMKLEPGVLKLFPYLREKIIRLANLGPADYSTIFQKPQFEFFEGNSYIQAIVDSALAKNLGWNDLQTLSMPDFYGVYPGPSKPLFLFDLDIQRSIDMIGPGDFRWPQKAGTSTCSTLIPRAQSLFNDPNSLTATAAFSKNTANHTAKTILEMCASCHSKPALAPQIPFDKPSLLAGQLARPNTSDNMTLLNSILSRISSSGNDPLHMPPERELNKDEQSLLQNYLRSLK